MNLEELLRFLEKNKDYSADWSINVIWNKKYYIEINLETMEREYNIAFSFKTYDEMKEKLLGEIQEYNVADFYKYYEEIFKKFKNSKEEESRLWNLLKKANERDVFLSFYSWDSDYFVKSGSFIKREIYEEKMFKTLDDVLKFVENNVLL